MASTRSKLPSILHCEMMKHLIERGRIPPPSDLAVALDVGIRDVRAAMQTLVETHGIVLHPGTEEVWVIPPFSLVPTALWVENTDRGWWAACIWCALGVCELVGNAPRIHTRIAGESEEVVIDASGDELRPAGLVAHFPIPLARAWDNVHRFCGSTLVFKDPQQVQAWCDRHSFPPGDIQPLKTIRRLARAWYGGHLSPEWEKWSRSEAKQILSTLGLEGPTWSVGEGDGKF